MKPNHQILIVDDDRDIAESLEEILQSKGISVKVANNFNSAVEALETFEPQVALLDIRLGRRSGVDLIALLKQRCPNIICIMMTGHATTETAVEALKNGAYDYLKKPFHFDDLHATLSRCFEKLEMQQVQEEAFNDLQLFRALINQSSDILFVCDADSGRFLYTNDFAHRALGRDETQLATMTLGAIQTAVDRYTTYEALRDAIIDAGRLMYQGEFQRPDGATLPVEVHVRYADHKSGRYLTGTARDITERRHIEEQLADERRNLERKVQDRTRELRDSLDQVEKYNLFLEDANQYKNRFLSTMSHELRTPLNAIIGFTSLLAGGYYGPLNEKQSGYVNQIDVNGHHLLTLINDLLELTRIGGGSMTVDWELIELPSFLESTVAIFKTQFLKKSLASETDLSAGPQLFRGDRRKCRQILFNLISNAIKFSREGGIITVRSEALPNRAVKVSVIDTGIGIAPQDQANIFSRFYQAEQVRNEQLGGAGIGLALTRRLVEMHGGEIGFESAPEKGSTFWFRLPGYEPSELFQVDE